MTLGRTSSGKIKIKTAGGGLRAVNCACCGGCGCASVSVSVDLLAVFENILTYPPCLGCSGYSPPPGYPSLPTCFGRPPDFFTIDADMFAGGFDFIWDFVGGGADFVAASYFPDQNCLHINGFNLDSDTYSFYNELYIGEIEGCCESGMTCSVAGDILINGQPFPAWNSIVDAGKPLVTPPIFVFP